MMIRALVSGTALSLAVTAAWSYSATLAVGPAPPLSLTRDLPGDYAQLAAAPTGNAITLFAVTAVIYTACFIVCGLLRIRREATEAREHDRADRAAAAAEHAAGWRG